ncbi:MAG: hypothetical protein ACO1NX_07765 [Chitinophagaceae bacterium]
MALLVVSCRQPQQQDNLIVGSWQFERMTTGPLQTSADTLTDLLAERVYLGSILRFGKDKNFEMSNRDSTSEFQGKGTYAISLADSTLTMERNTKGKGKEKVTMQLMSLTADSLKLGNETDMMVFSRMPQ